MKTLLLIAFLFARLATGGSVLAVYLVTPDTGAPQPGVTLEIEDAEGVTHTGTSDAQGIVRFENLPGTTVWIKRAMFRGNELLMDTNDLERGGLHLPLIVGGEQRVQYAADEQSMVGTLEMPPPAQPFPTNTPEPTATPRPQPTATPVPTDVPTAAPTALPTVPATVAPTAVPTAATTAAPPEVAAAPGESAGGSAGAAPEAAAAMPEAEQAAPSSSSLPLTLLGIGLAILGAAGYGWWRLGRRG